MCSLLKERSETYWNDEKVHVHIEELVSPIKGRMVVALDGVILYQKGPPNMKHPQPTPSEIEELLETLFSEYPFTEEERTQVKDLHAQHIIDLALESTGGAN